MGRQVDEQRAARQERRHVMISSAPRRRRSRPPRRPSAGPITKCVGERDVRAPHWLPAPAAGGWKLVGRVRWPSAAPQEPLRDRGGRSRGYSRAARRPLLATGRSAARAAVPSTATSSEHRRQPEVPHQNREPAVTIASKHVQPRELRASRRGLHPRPRASAPRTPAAPGRLNIRAETAQARCAVWS